MVESAGLTNAYIVYIQVYLQDVSKYAEMNRIFGSYFAEPRPARAVLGVAELPEPGIEISALAVRDPAQRRAISPGERNKDDSSSPAFSLMTGSSSPESQASTAMAMFPAILQRKSISRSTG